MSATQTTRSYPVDEFTSASSNPNAGIFAVEVAALALSVQPGKVYRVGSVVLIEWTALPTAADLALIDAAVAAIQKYFRENGTKQIAADKSDKLEKLFDVLEVQYTTTVDDYATYPPMAQDKDDPSYGKH